MQRGYLVLESNEFGRRRVPVGKSIIIGRASDCGFAIDDGAASRHHAQITAKDTGFFWKDLGSTNGTLLNEQTMLEGRLRGGDVLKIGETGIRFEIEEIEDKPTKPEDTTLFKETILDADGQAVRPSTAENAAKLLEAVYAIMNEIATNYETCSLLDHILETTLKAIKAQRGAVLFSENKEFQPCPICSKYHVIQDGRLHHVALEEIRISKTVTTRVLENGESVLYQDTSKGDQVDLSESMLSMNLNSIMCVPLRGKAGIIGLLYIDSNRPRHQYTNEDMLLITAVGNSAGLAIENATMHQQILEKQRTDQEIQHAWTIQQGFLVKDWATHDTRFQIYGETRPAKTVGGDFYDFLKTDAQHIGVLIGDVSGKGVPAALTMAQLLAEFRSQARTQPSPSKVLQFMNKSLYERSQHGMFCTVCYILLDLTSGKVKCANAGHHPPLCVETGRSRSFGAPTGPPLGILPNLTWEDTETVIEPGENILLYTDGIVEARPAADQTRHGGHIDEFGLAQLESMAQRHANETPEGLIKAVNAGVIHHCAPLMPHDDCTMICVKFTNTDVGATVILKRGS